jgi:SsrA-binding protein
LHPLAPEASASTSSTTSARTERNLDGARTQVNETRPFLALRGDSNLRQVAEPEEKPRQSVARNKRASHDYHILETWEAGLVLTGSEVKSLRNGRANIGDAYAILRDGEVYLINLHISPYEQASYFNHDPTRTRKLLLHKKEIRKMIGAVERQGLTLIPLELYFKKGKAKVALALGKGKKLHDKRADIKKKDAEREIARARSIRA